MFLISCGNSKKQELMKLIEQNTDSIGKYAKASMDIHDIPYPSDPIEQLKRKLKHNHLNLQAQIFRDRVDSLKYEIMKLD